MPRGRGFAGRGFWGAGMMGGYPFYGYPMFGGGRGNPFGFCRWFPWLPRWWWATPYAAQYAATIPYYGMGYGMVSGYSMGYGTGLPYSPYGMSPYATPYSWGSTPSGVTAPTP